MFELPSSLGSVRGQKPDLPDNSMNPLYPIFLDFGTDEDLKYAVDLGSDS